MSAQTAAFVRMMRKFSVFENIDPSLLPNDAPEVLILCFDPDRFGDMWQHHHSLGGIRRCCPPVSYPGGSLAIAEHSPLASTPDGHNAAGVLLNAIRFAKDALGANKIRPLVHYPCGQAREIGLSDIEALRLHIAAKERLRREFPGTDIALLVHVDWLGYPEGSDGEMKTYKFSRSAFQIWEESDSGRVFLSSAA